MKCRLQIHSTLMVALCLSGAGWGQSVAAVENDPAVNAVAGSAAPVTPMPRTGAASQFVLGASDVIRVSVWKNPDLSQTVTVGPDGFVSLPLLGDVQVAGLTADQLGKALASRLTTYIMSPQVTVSVVDIRSRQVYILGQVTRPGNFVLIAPMRVLQLIAQAGGLTNYANRKSIVVLHAEQGTVRKITFNYNNAVRGDARQNIMLQPGDTVVVP